MNTATTIVGTLAMVAGSAIAGVTVTQGSSAPTYSTTLNFDEPGGPTGLVATDAWLDLGVAELQSGDSVPQVGVFDTDPGGPWVGTGNSFFGNFGIIMKFTSGVTDFSAQIWDPSGPAAFFGGGMLGVAFDDGVEVGSFFSEAGPAWGGIGDEWWNFTADAGESFDEVRLFGFGFTPFTFGDNFSWNAVPTPGSFAVLGLGGFMASRRRR